MSDIFLPRVLTARAVYWEPTTAKDEFGKPKNANPIEIRVRWDESKKVIIGRDGREVVSFAQVMCDRDLQEEGFLRLGKITTLQYPNDPKSNDGVYEIKSFERTPSFKGTKFVRVAYL